MIIILHPDTDKNGQPYHALLDHLTKLSGIQHRVHEEVGTQQTLTEIYLIGDTASIDGSQIESFASVERVVRISHQYRILGRHKDDNRPSHFTYNGVTFGQDNFYLFAGLCAVDTRDHVENMMRSLRDHGQICTRMGAYKPRTNPYSFQGHGKSCLPYVFELAGKYDIKVIAMEVTHEDHIDEIHEVLERSGNPTGVMLQIGTRNAQNFELLKNVGRQKTYPVLLKRGFGITLEESLNAAEYLASEGNRKVVFCLRGMKTNLGDPHRNVVDFAHVPVVKRLTRMPVCVDPSHSVGSRGASPDGIMDVMHASVQGVIAGANMVLVDFHPEPTKALVDGPQALSIEELPWFLEDVQIAREAYEKRLKLVQRVNPPNALREVG
ncbi:MAG: 3-deoxy-7-phosphoheptulonate synthase [Gammaproteobacteria bacterium]